MSAQPHAAGAAPTITVYRIGADTPTYSADDRTGVGAKRDGGRWNRKGSAVLYTSSSRALACLETLAHLSRTGTLPYNRYLVEYTMPASAWTARVRCELAVNVGWDALPAGLVSHTWGTDWLASEQSLVAEVPSVVVPEESHVLLNPAHPEMANVAAHKVRRWYYDPRLIPGPSATE